MLRSGRARVFLLISVLLVVGTVLALLIHAGGPAGPPTDAHAVIAALNSGRPERIQSYLDPAVAANGAVLPLGSKVTAVTDSWQQESRSASVNVRVTLVGGRVEVLRFYLLHVGVNWQIEFSMDVR